MTVWNVETRVTTARFQVDTVIERVVLPANGPRPLASYKGGCFEYLDNNKGTVIINPEREDMSRFFPNGVPMSRSDHWLSGEHLVGYFPEHRVWVPILWIPRDVYITAFAAEPSIFAVACDDGRLIFGHVPLASGN